MAPEPSGAGRRVVSHPRAVKPEGGVLEFGLGWRQRHRQLAQHLGSGACRVSQVALQSR